MTDFSFDYDELLWEAQQLAGYRKLAHCEASAESFNASCGDRIVVAVAGSAQDSDEVGWHGEGCVISQVAMSRAIGLWQSGEQSLEVLAELDPTEFRTLLGFESIGMGRYPCVLLAQAAIKKLVGLLASRTPAN